MLETFIWFNSIRGGARDSLQRVITAFGEKEFATIQAYCRKEKLSLYALAKAAIREHLRRHP